MRIAEPQLRPEADGVEELDDALVDLGAPGQPVEADRLPHDLCAGHAWIERGVRVLEDDVHPAPVRSQAAARQVRDVGAVEPDRPVRRLVEPVDAVADRRLPAARLADEAEHLPWSDRERHAVDRVDDAAAAGHSLADREVLDQPVDFEHRLQRVRHRSPGWKHADGMVLPNLAELRHRRPRLLVCARAPVRERAVRGKLGERGHAARNLLEPAVPRCARPRNRPEQPDRVRVLRVGEKVLHRRLLRLPAGVHDHHAVGEVCDHAQVVRDQDDRGAEPLSNFAQEVEDPGLNGHVERRRGLVGDQDLRVARKRNRDHHPLAHPAGELVRVLLDPAARVRDVHEIEQLHHPRPGLTLGHVHVLLHDLLDLASDPEHRIQRGHRLLEDERDLPSTDLPQARPGRSEQLVPLEEHAPGDARRLREEAEDREGRHALPAAGLAHDSQDLARLEGQRHAVDGMDTALVRVEADREVTDVEEGLGQRSVLGSRTSRRPSPSRLNASATITIARPG